MPSQASLDWWAINTLIEPWPPSPGDGGQIAIANWDGIRVTHIPSGIVAIVCTERSQHRNLEIARAMIEAGLTHPKFGGESDV